VHPPIDMVGECRRSDAFYGGGRARLARTGRRPVVPAALREHIIPNLRLRPGLLVEAAINLRRTWLACTEERATQAAEGTRDRSLS